MKNETEYIVTKVADFGIPKRKENMMSLNMSILRATAPEMIESPDYLGRQDEFSNDLVEEGDAMVRTSLKPDMHSFAMVCYEIVTGEVPYFL